MVDVVQHNLLQVLSSLVGVIFQWVVSMDFVEGELWQREGMELSPICTEVESKLLGKV
jgi:hypothetical protein